MIKRTPLFTLLSVIIFFQLSAQRSMENLDRGLVAFRTSETEVFLSWRLLGTDPEEISFDLYRGDTLITTTTATNFVDHTEQNKNYCIKAVMGGVEQPDSACSGITMQPYIGIPLEPLEADYYVHFVWVGDLDGDGEYDFVVDRLPNDEDKSPMVEAYRRDGTFLWRYDTGPTSLSGDRFNPGAASISRGHSDGLTVYDLDSDGQSEVIIKTANGSVFGDGTTLVHDSDTVQFVSVLNGVTGAEEARIQIPNDYNDVAPLAGHFGIMYCDGTNPSVVFKGKNRRPDGGFNLSATTYDYTNGELSLRWKWNRDDKVGGIDAHQIRIIDVDDDGKDELCDGGYVIDDDGTLLYSIPGVVHGDRFHITDFDPDRPGLEGFYIQQNNQSGLAWVYYDAKNGSIIQQQFLEGPEDLARGTAADLYPQHKGIEFWTFTDGIYTPSSEEPVSTDHPWPNFKLWWDGDLLGELLNAERVSKWNTDIEVESILLDAGEYGAIDSWRDAAQFHGDIIGDWREEVVFANEDQSEIMIFSTTEQTDERIYTLPHNPGYRACMTVKGYQQSHLVDYYLGYEMDTPPSPNISIVPRNKEPDENTPLWRPQHLTALGVDSTVSLTWGINPDSEVVGYNLYRSETSGGPYEKQNDTPVTSDSYLDTSVILETTYYYVVTSVDSESNESNRSDEVSATPTLRPDPPTGLIADAVPDTVSLVWRSHDDPDVVGYNVYRSETSGEFYTKLNQELLTDTTCTDLEIVNETTYYYVITAVNNLDLESPFSNEAFGTPGYSIFLQAEEAEFGGEASHDSNHGNFFGTGFINFPGTDGFIEFRNIDGGEGDTVFLKYRYALDNDPRTGILVINGEERNLTMESTGGWSTWRTDELVVVLQSGSDNVIRFQSTGEDFGNLDQIVIAPAPSGTVPDEILRDKLVVIEENEEGFCYVDGVINEDLGIANTDNALGFGVNWSIVTPQAGDYEFSWRYYTREEGVLARILVNGEVAQDSYFFPAGSGELTMSGAASLTLEEGVNEIRLESGDEAGLVDIDYIQVYGLEPEPLACEGEGERLPPLSVDDVSFSIYPNPVKHGNAIRIHATTPINAVALFHINGQQVYSQTGIMSEKIAIMPNLQSGIYILSVRIGDQEIRKKIIFR